jgi:hypothetical protein
MSDVKDKDPHWWIGIFLMPAIFLTDGFVVMKLWGWHVAPLFDWPALTLGRSIGIQAIIAVISFNPSRPTNDTTAIVRGGSVLLASWLMLLVGWLAS